MEIRSIAIAAPDVIAFKINAGRQAHFAIRPIFAWLLALALVSAAVMIAYLWLDRPIAFWVHDHVRRSYHVALNQAGHYPNPLIPLAVIVFVLLGLRALSGRPLFHGQVVAFICSMSIILTGAIKDLLKYVFGRTWPETWIAGNPSLMGNGAYGFHFMQNGSAYQSFPSGHMAVTCAMITVLWIWYARFRMIYLIAALAAGSGLVLLNYHFVSDVIAGAFVGVSAGWMMTAIARESVTIFLQGRRA